ncbi:MULTISPECIES: caspase family protein [Cyanophyceae]|uniref:Caspase family protein n=1 Tax=Leptolyngbya subtilissima DQ-A4 TaxID=2933933 RepID=A0ABV0KBF1_9CYAN|nr:caspase family protein [Nodosilinea sp. FACHB-141]MBD2115086.1 caspase family protein [Nodosilinea sp. FACHB-141]
MTEPTVDPSHVHALVVGIEQYQAGPAYDLNGPARDALGFAHWLLAHGVQPANIQLFLSPLDQNREVLAEAETQGLSPQEATRDRISRTITDRFVDRGGRERRLYVFWAGHGFITKLDTTTRRLLFADTNTRNKWNLDFDTLLQAFQTAKHGAVFPRQIFLIDACANPMFQDFYPTLQAAAAGEGFVTSGTQGQAEQFALFAAAEYAVATNLTQAGTGRFSRAVLEELQAQPLWPNMPELTSKIKANFRDQQHLEPVFWSVSLGSGDREVTDTISQRITIMPAPAIAMSGSERFQLIKTLNDLPIVEFEILVNTLNPPGGLVPPSSAAQGIRSSALLQWIEGPTGPGLNELQAVLGQVMVGASAAQKLNDSAKPSTNNISSSSKKDRLQKEIQMLEAQLERCFSKRLLTNDPDAEVKFENLENKLEQNIALKKSELESLN